MPLETTSKWHGYLVNSAIGLLMIELFDEVPNGIRPFAIIVDAVEDVASRLH